MSWVTLIWSMIASASLTLSAIYLLVWYSNRAAWAHLMFSVTSAATGVLAFCELLVMRAATPAELLAVTTWTHVPLFLWLVSISWFVWFYLGAGRLWLLWTICALRGFSLVANLLLGQDPSFRPITSLQHIQFLGESVTIIGGVPNRLTLITQVGTLLILVFIADAGVTAWRRGDHRKALLVGGGAEFFVLAGLLSASIANWSHLQVPIAFSPFGVALAAVMAYELSREVLRASELVNELRESERGLRESEERVSLAVEVADLGVWTRDLERNEIWASEQWRRLFGFAPSQHLTMEAMLQRVHPDDRDAFEQCHALAAAESAGGTFQLDHRLTLPDGGARWVVSHSRIERDPDGKPLMIRGASRDITGRKHAEQETLLMREEIAHAGRVTMLGQLASALAHEINQPLGAILRNAEAAELFLQHPSPDLDEIRAIFADIRKDDQRAGAVIDRMRGLLKRRSLDPQPLDVREVVGEVAALIRVDAVTRQVKLEVNVARDVPRVRGDRIHIQQVLLNLIMNGMDALNQASLSHRRVRVTAECNGAQTVAFGVVDAGPGIPADALARVFDPFFTTKPNGMGMGLPISRTIIEAHGGRIWAENQAEGGAAFRFTLPIADETPR
jgi:two-component system, LuxR family, sensor kinase FixL